MAKVLAGGITVWTELSSLSRHNLRQPCAASSDFNLLLKASVRWLRCVQEKTTCAEKRCFTSSHVCRLAVFDLNLKVVLDVALHCSLAESPHRHAADVGSTAVIKISVLSMLVRMCCMHNDVKFKIIWYHVHLCVWLRRSAQE